MTKPHLGSRGAGRQRGYTKISAPRGVDRRRGHGDGRHHRTVRSAAFFTKFCQRTWDVKGYPFLCSWTRPNVSKPAPGRSNVLNRPNRPEFDVLRSQTVLNRPLWLFPCENERNSKYCEIRPF